MFVVVVVVVDPMDPIDDEEAEPADTGLGKNEGISTSITGMGNGKGEYTVSKGIEIEGQGADRTASEYCLASTDCPVLCLCFFFLL